MAEKIPEKQEEVKAFRKQHGNTKVGEITVDMVRNYLATYDVVLISYIIAISSYLKNRGHAKVIVILMHFYWQRCVMLLKNVNDENREIAFEFFFALFCNVLDNKKNLSEKRLYTYDFHFCILLIRKGIMNFEICKETLT